MIAETRANPNKHYPMTMSERAPGMNAIALIKYNNVLWWHSSKISDWAEARVECVIPCLIARLDAIPDLEHLQIV